MKNNASDIFNMRAWPRVARKQRAATFLELSLLGEQGTSCAKKVPAYYARVVLRTSTITHGWFNRRSPHPSFEIPIQPNPAIFSKIFASQHKTRRKYAGDCFSRYWRRSRRSREFTRISGSKSERMVQS